MQHIIIVEDDDSIREMVMYALTSAGFRTTGFESGSEAIDAMPPLSPDLILLDIMLPGMDGIAILKTLRQHHRTRHTPVIMLTAKGSEMDKIRGLDLGADDYITKPFSILEVVSRVKAVLRRCQSAPEEPADLRCGAIVLRPARRTVHVDGEEVVLTFKEFELLECLMRNQGIVLTRDRLLEEVWGFDYGGESRTVDMHIKTLRQKLLEAGPEIKTVRNVGYKIGG